TDYALLLISRYRDELSRTPDRHAAMAVALRRTTPAVLASAATMMLAALALLAASMNSTRGLAPVAAVAGLAAPLVVTTLLPAILVALGRWVFWPTAPKVTNHRIWKALARLVSHRPRRVWTVTALLLLAASASVLSLRVETLAGADNFTRQPESVVGQSLL